MTKQERAEIITAEIMDLLGSKLAALPFAPAAVAAVLARDLAPVLADLSDAAADQFRARARRMIAAHVRGAVA